MKLNKKIIKVLPALMLVAMINNCVYSQMTEDVNNYSLDLEKTKIATLEPHLFYFHPDMDNELSWKVLEGESVSEELNYEIIDVDGSVVSKGAAIMNNSGRINTTVNLPRGYYIIRFTNLDIQFGLSVLPFLDPDSLPDRFFAVHADLCHDDRLTHLDAADKEERYENLFRVLHKTGIRKVRDRVRPVMFAPNPDTWDWQGTVYRYENARQLFDKYDIDVLGYFALSPVWMKRSEDIIPGSNRKENKFPADLHAMTDVWLKIYERWRNELETIELYNEPTGVTEDRLAPLVNAMTYRFKTAGYNDVDIATAAFAGLRKRYTQHLGEMKVYDGIDKITFHTYANPDQLVGRTEFYMDAPGKFGYPNMPVSITEAGEKYVGGLWPTLEQEKNRCKTIIGNAVESRATGINGFYSFIFKAAHFKEGDNITQHSLIDIYGTPFLTMAAYANAINQLSHKEYLGDMQINHKDINRIRVFGDGEDAVAVITADIKSSINLSVPVKEITGIDGRKITPDVNGNIPLEDHIVYVTFNQSDIESEINSDTEAMELYKRAQQSDNFPSRKTYPVVLQHFADYDHLEFGASAYNMATILDQDVTLTFQVSNMSGQDRDIEVELEMPEFLTTQEPSVKSLHIPANSKKKIHWKVAFDQNKPGFIGDVTLKPTSDYESIVSPVIFGVKCPRPVEEVLKSFNSYRKIDIYDESKWSMAGTNTIDLNIQVNRDEVEFGLKVEDNRSWSAGRYDISDYDLTHTSGLLVVAREDKIPDNVSKFWPKVSFGVEEQNGANYLGGRIPNDGRVHWTFIEFGAMPVNVNDNNQTLDVDEIENFLVHTWHGMTDRTVHYEVFDVYIVSDSLLFEETAFDVQLNVKKKKNEPIAQATIMLDTGKYITNDAGVVILSQVSYGFYNININADGYLPLEVPNVEIFSDTILTFKAERDKPDVTFKFIDAANGSPLSRVMVIANNTASFTKNEGMVTFNDISDDKVILEATRDSYFDVNDSAIIENDTIITIPMTKTMANVNFIISGDDHKLSNVLVDFAGRTGFSGTDGEVTFFNQPARQFYDFEISIEGFKIVSDSLFLESDTAIHLSLEAVTNNQFINNDLIKVYPNPFINHLSVFSKYSKGIISLCDLQGRVLFEKQIVPGKQIIPLAHLTEGFYMLSIRAVDQWYCFRVLKQLPSKN